MDERAREREEREESGGEREERCTYVVNVLPSGEGVVIALESDNTDNHQWQVPNNPTELEKF